MSQAATASPSNPEAKAWMVAMGIMEIIRDFAPRITVASAIAFALIVIRTMDRKQWKVPTNGDIAQHLNLSPSGASRLLSSLTSQGRSRGVDQDNMSNNGYDLIQTNDWVKGKRADAYVLTDKGRECAAKVMRFVMEKDEIDYNPHDMDSLFKLMIIGDGSMDG